MAYSPENNPYIPGDPYSYDLKWMVDKINGWKDPLDSAERAKASEEAAAASADAAAGSAGSAAGSVSTISSYINDVNGRLGDVESDMAVLDARMDAFSTLAEGSTTGDAELMDIRVGYNGITYATAGDAVRAQISQLESTIYYVGYERYTVTSGSRMSPPGDITLKADTMYRISVKSANTSYTRLRFFPYNIATSSVDTSYFTEIYSNTNTVNFSVPFDAHLCLYNVQNIASITTEINVFEYKPEQLATAEKIYYVSKNTNISGKTHYDSVTKCLKDLEGDESPKTIIIEGGTYDIYQEYVDENIPVPTPDVSTSNYFPYNVFVPKNTHIIGRGLVRLEWAPTNLQVSAIQSQIVSPLNVADSCVIENIEVYCKNGRYCLHNDAGDAIKYAGAKTRFINCRFYKDVNDTGFGFAQTIGFALNARMTQIYDSCEFYNEDTAASFYGHSRASIGGISLAAHTSPNMILRNCIIVTPYAYSCRFDNDNISDLHINVKLEGCYLSGGIRINTPSGYTNGFALICLKSGNPTITGDYGALTPVIYQ